MPKKKGSGHKKRITRVKPQKLVRVFQKLGFEVSRKSKKHIVMRKEGHTMNLAIPNHPGDEGVCAGVIISLIRKAGISRSKYLDLLKKS